MLRAFLLCIPYSSKCSYYFNRLCAKDPFNVMKKVFPVLSRFSPIKTASNFFSFLRFSVQNFLIFFLVFSCFFLDSLYFSSFSPPKRLFLLFLSSQKRLTTLFTPLLHSHRLHPHGDRSWDIEDMHSNAPSAFHH